MLIDDDGLLGENFFTTSNKNKLDPDQDDRSWYVKQGGNLVKFGSYICHLSYKQISNQEHERHSRVPSWPQIVYCFQWYFTVRLIVAVYYHCVFDYHKYKLDHFDLVAERLGDRYSLPSQAEHMAIFRDQLVANYESARNATRFIGAPFLNRNYIMKNIFIHLTITCNIAYVLPHFFNKFRNPLDINIIHTILAPHRLQESIDCLIHDEVNNFILSSRTYYNLLICKLKTNVSVDDAHLILQTHVKYDSDRLEDDLPSKRITSSGQQPIRLFEAIKNHKFSVRNVKSMAHDGLFQPFNRRKEWIRLLAGMYGALSIFSFAFGVSTLIVIQLILPFTVLDVPVEQRMMDWVFHVEIFIFISTSIISGAFYSVGVVIICLDQAHEISELNRLIENCISHNAHKLERFIEKNRFQIGIEKFVRANAAISNRSFVEDSRSSNPSNTIGIASIATTGDTLFERPYEACIPRAPDSAITNLHSPDSFDGSLNLFLMHTLLQYRIFVKQLRSPLESIQIYCTLALLTTSILPLVTRLFIAYLNRSRKIESIFVCVLILVLFDLGLLLVCQLHTRSPDIHKNLHSLLAHIIDMNHYVGRQIVREVYDGHLIWMLRRELLFPERLKYQFATHLFGTQFNMTYAVFLKYHFWWGALMISITALDPSLPNASDIFGGIWRFYSGADADISRFFSNLTTAGAR